jgi:hypothetical protein
MEQELIQLSLGLYRDTGWKLKREKQYERIYENSSVYRLVMTLPCNATVLRDFILTDAKNPLILEMTTVEADYEKCRDVVRVISAPGGGGFVPSREHRYLRLWRDVGEKHFIVAKSLVDHEGMMAWLITPYDTTVCTLDYLVRFDKLGPISISYIFLKSYIKHLKLSTAKL